MRVVVVGLTSAAGSALNGCQGLVQPERVKPGRVAVLLDGDGQPSSIRLDNLRKAHVL